MTTHDPDRMPDRPLPEDLHRSLQALRRDSVPGRDLWPGIAARIADAQAASPPLPLSSRPRRSRRSRRLVGLATAASFAAALAVAWMLLPPSPSSSPRDDAVAGLLLREARSMTRDYQAAWHALDARRRPGTDTAALREIDRSAAEVRAALRKDPDARFLFERLQSLYARRLDIARRLAT